ncbi:MAG: peptidoglycan editing factor PgeF [Pseudomonadota bacterium]
MTDLQPDWVLPGGALHGRVGALSTTRMGGVSRAPFDALNLGDHVGDNPHDVARNRAMLATRVAGRELMWLTQVHGTDIVSADDWQIGMSADGAVVTDDRHCAVVMTADCLPVLMAADDGSVVAAVHAGWRGLAGGVLLRALATLAAPHARVLAWIGPAISCPAFEVGDEVRVAFIEADASNEAFFVANPVGRFQADLSGLARHQLLCAGVSQVTAADACTYNDASRFFSHRRAAPCGRMATAIWRI